MATSGEDIEAGRVTVEEPVPIVRRVSFKLESGQRGTARRVLTAASGLDRGPSGLDPSGRAAVASQQVARQELAADGVKPWHAEDLDDRRAFVKYGKAVGSLRYELKKMCGDGAKFSPKGYELLCHDLEVSSSLSLHDMRKVDVGVLLAVIEAMVPEQYIRNRMASLTLHDLVQVIRYAVDTDNDD
jgi:hypothetical protein